MLNLELFSLASCCTDFFFFFPLQNGGKKYFNTGLTFTTEIGCDRQRQCQASKGDGPFTKEKGGGVLLCVFKGIKVHKFCLISHFFLKEKQNLSINRAECPQNPPTICAGFCNFLFIPHAVFLFLVTQYSHRTWRHQATWSRRRISLPLRGRALLTESKLY